MGKRYLEKKKVVKIKKVEEEVVAEPEKKTLLNKMSTKFSIYTVLLALILIFMLYVRIALPYDSVFIGNYVNFAADDAVYHMRLVENTIANYPARILYDPFTHYPFGSGLHFGPLWTLLIATAAILLGARAPTDPIVYITGAYMPAILGTLTAIPAYYIAKTLYGRNAGLISALILGVLPGQFLSRTVVGFSDHHVAEIFFSTLTMSFFVLAINETSKLDIRFSNFAKGEFKKGFIYSILAGIAFSAYLLSWPGAVLFSLIIFIFILIQSIIDNYNRKSLDYLVIASLPSFLLPIISIVPYFIPTIGWSRYSWFHVAILGLGAVALIVLSLISRAIQKRNLNAHYYPVSLAGLGALGLIILFFASRDLFNSLFGTFMILSPSSTSVTTISEVMPMLTQGNQFTLAHLYGNFALIFFFAMIGLVLTLYKLKKSWRASETLFAVWNIVIIWATIAQNRFAYYSAINVAILAGYFWWKVFERAGFEKFLDGLSNSDMSRYISRNLKWTHIFVVAAFILIALFPAYGLSIQNTHSGGADGDWINSLMWMRNNTPDPDLDYYGIYKEPNIGGFYDYPKTAYGVMSWWDYGHIITYIAHRIPNANPFQAGIIEQNWTGAAPFLTAENETEGNRILDFLGSRYVISDAPMAGVKFWAIGTYAKNGNIEECYRYYFKTAQTPQGTQQYYTQNAFNTMEIRLHYFDGDHLDIAKGTPDGNYLTRYRLIYESPAVVGSIGNNQIHYIKIFEYVKGARIKGDAPAGAQVNLTLNVTSNQGGTFVYKQHVVSNSRFEFVVPYSNTGPAEGGTNFAVLPPGPYRIEFGNTTKEVTVTEKDVMDGNTISI